MQKMDIAFQSYLNDSRYPRPLRLNNPGGILKSKKDWQGKITKSEKDRTYEVFDNYYNGITAMIEILDGYYHDEKATTLEKLIYRYAKPGSLVQPFVEYVSKGSGFRPRQRIPWKCISIRLIVEEICRYENKGRNPMLRQDIFEKIFTHLFPNSPL